MSVLEIEDIEMVDSKQFIRTETCADFLIALPKRIMAGEDMGSSHTLECPKCADMIGELELLALSVRCIFPGGLRAKARP